MALQNVISDNSFKSLTRVPDQVLGMTNLRMLYMDGNSLESLPEDFFDKLPKLYWLDLRGNKLEAIPSGVGNHKFLENLLLQHNRIRRLPNELGLVPNLKVVQLTDNPLEYPSKDIMEKGVESICDFLKQQYNKQNSPPPKDDDTKLSERSFSSTSISTVPSVHAMAVKKRLSKKIARPPVIVTALSKPPPSIIQESSSKEKKVHKITRSASKISVHSHYSGKNSNRVSWGLLHPEKQDKRVLEEQIRETWLNRLKDLIRDQEKILQQEKTLARLSSWRLQKKQEPSRSPSEELKRVSAVPFDSNPVYNQLMSRNVVMKNVEKLVAAQNSSKKRTDEDVDRLISDVIVQLKGLEQKLKKNSGVDGEVEVSPSDKLRDADAEIQLIVSLHKKIAQIQSENSLR